MNTSFSFIQIVFSILCILFSVNFSMHFFKLEPNWVILGVGIGGGIILTTTLFILQQFLKKCHLRSFNTTVVGLFFGYLMAKTILFTFSGIMGEWEEQYFFPARFLVFLFSSYTGISLVMRTEKDIRLSLPFLEFKMTNQKKKDILVDLSILSDPRIIDLASSGLLDHHLIIPRFALKELYTQSENGDEGIRMKSRRSLESIKKLENLPFLDLRYTDTDFPDIKDSMTKLVRLAQLMDTHIITSDINKVQQSSIDGIRIINIQMLSHTLKPITQAGEPIAIKIQRHGKEARQGVGYLEDGTMVVVNGGAEFMDKTIKAYVLSVKQTLSGRMIFCNVSENPMSGVIGNDFVHADDIESVHKLGIR